MKNSNPFHVNKLLLIIIFTSFFLGSCKNDFVVKDKSNSREPYTVAELKQMFRERLYSEKKGIDWTTENDANFLFSAAYHTNSRFAIGYKPADFGKVRGRVAEIDFDTQEWKDATAKVIQFLEKAEEKPADEILYKVRKTPCILVYIKKLSTIEKLLLMDEIRYIEVMDTSVFEPMD